MRDWLIRRAKRTPYYHLAGYMNRWWLVPYRQRIVRISPDGELHNDGTGLVSLKRPIAYLLQLFNISVRIHEILRSDEGRHPHDHPFNYLTIILKGHYLESRYNDLGELISIRLHGPGSVLWRPARSWHKLTLVPGTTVTTLFFTGAKADGGKWGFNVNGVKVPHRIYKAERGWVVD